ncbi:MAG: hypothetical protein LH630_05575, partial [Actinomycetia bacterium]|nr:hypothetical protein [Actinomycetes bacterium]
MIKGALALAIVATVPSLGSATASADIRALPPSVSAQPAPVDRLVVKFATTGVTARAAASSEATRVSSRTPRPLGGGWFLVRGIDDLGAARATLAASPGVRRVQADHSRRAFGDRYYRRYQPYLRASMDVDRAWRRSSGRGVTVAVIDTGVDPNHEDLPKLLRGRDFLSRRPNPSARN